MAKRVSGIGGVFFKAKDPKTLGDWYAKHLDFELEENAPATTFRWLRKEDPSKGGATVWSLFPADTDYFGDDANVQFMVNYRVDDLPALMETLKKEGVTVLRETTDTPYGKFSAILDPEGNAIELWEPPENY